MPSTFKKITNNTLFRYIFIGGLSYLIEVITIYVIINYSDLGSLTAVAISFWLGLIASFFLQKFLAFKNKESSAKHLIWQSITYSILVIINYLFTLGFVAIFENTVGVFIARTIALIITTGWNFIVYSKVIFKRNLEN